METVFERCAGIDVHKDFVQVCVRVGHERQEVRRFSTMTKELLVLSDWLASERVTHVAMESTGVYWKPVYHVLEEQFTVLLCNAQHLRHVPGRKTDVKDCQWIAQLLQSGLLRGSFVPPAPLQELRDLTRTRAAAVGDLNRQKNRLLKVLEDANVKLASVATDPFGVSGRAMIEALIAGERRGEQLAELARGRLRSKKDFLAQALAGRVTAHHRLMLKLTYARIREIEAFIAELEEHIEEYIVRDDLNEEAQGESVPFLAALELLESVPGINRCVAITLLAEIGTDMSRFPTAAHLASWAGMCPGQNESAGKRKSGRITGGNRWVRRAITQAAWAASHSKKSFLRARYHRLAARRGKKRAIIAVAHSLLNAIHEMLSTGAYYHDLGADYFDRVHAQRLTNYYVKRLKALGHHVDLQPAA